MINNNVKPEALNLNQVISSLKLFAGYSVLAIGHLLLPRCSEDDQPKTFATVSTLAPTEVTTTTAIAHGEITDNGDAKISESGFVYSTIIEQPTIADTKVVVEPDNDDVLETLLENLSSGSIYYIRAFATNSQGTAYGEPISFETGNAAPTAINVTITGDNEVYETLTASYTYSDSENDPQGVSTFQWYAADNAAGLNEVAIQNATTLTYFIKPEDGGKYIRFGVTPKALSEGEGGVEATGDEVKSSFTNGIGEVETVTFMYNGDEVTYGIINSPVTGKKWLDRNLGAPGVPLAHDDYVNYGDIFQWGRSADGHQLITNGRYQTEVTGVSTLGTIVPNGPAWTDQDDPGHSNFIIVTGYWASNDPYDWRKPQNENLWQGVSGINNPCPSGWRIPTKADFEEEDLMDAVTAYQKLKLTYSYFRNADGYFGGGGTSGFYWTSTRGVSEYGWNGSHQFIINSSVWLVPETRVIAMSCRCIKD